MNQVKSGSKVKYVVTKVEWEKVWGHNELRLSRTVCCQEQSVTDQSAQQHIKDKSSKILGKVLPMQTTPTFLPLPRVDLQGPEFLLENLVTLPENIC